MKTFATLILIVTILPATAQVVSNVNWELEGNERIIITYDLAKLDDYIYFDVSVIVKIENKVVPAKALSGDVGSFVRIGTKKKIVWNMFEDISDLNGELSVEVQAVNPVPSTSATTMDTEKNSPSAVDKLRSPKIPFWAGMGGIGVTGVGLLAAGIKSAGDGQDLYKIYKENTIEASAVYSDLGSTRDEVYSEANKKYKNGSLLEIAGAAVLVTAGVIIVNRMIQAKKIDRQRVAVFPNITVDSGYASGKVEAYPGFAIHYRIGRTNGR
jgi:hypothetical protein